MTKAKAYCKKKDRIDYNDIKIIRRMEQACEDVKKGTKFLTAAKKHKVRLGTLRNRFYNRTQSAKKAHSHERLMDDSQEMALVDWMVFLGVTGRPISRKTLRPKCVQICGKLPGRTWIWRFLKRHRHLMLKKVPGLDPKRAQAFNYPDVKAYFERLMKVIEENDIPWENIYNMDEKGIQLGGGRKGDGQKYFISREDRGTCYILRSANLELVTVIESCCADGTTFKPGFVFSGKSVSSENIEVHPDICVGTSENGWTSDTLCTQWFEKSFLPQALARNTSGKKILLIFDGHGSHVTDRMIDLAIAGNVELFLLLAHTTHKCQPLDVGVFGPGQRAWAQRCDAHLADTGRPMLKEEVVGEYMKAREKAFTTKTVVSAWIKCGIRLSANGVSGVDAFKPADFAPSNNTSTHAHLPSTFPTEFPSDFEPWPGAEEPSVPEDEETPAVHDSGSPVIQMSQQQFFRMWESGDGGEQSEESDPGSDDDSDESDEDDNMDSREKRAPAQQHIERMVDSQEEQHATSESTTHGIAASSSMACDARVISESEAPHMSASRFEIPTRNSVHPSSSASPFARSTRSTTAPASTPSTFTQPPQHQPQSELQTKRLNDLLRTPPRNLSKGALITRDKALRNELGLIRSQRNSYKTHAVLAHQELDRAHQIANSKKRKKGPAVKIANGELLTSAEAIERRAVASAEKKAKDDARVAREAKKDGKRKAEEERRKEAIRDTTVTFSGSISSKNKSDLQLILVTLGQPSEGTCPILKERLLKYFEEHPEDKQLPRYYSLFNNRGRRTTQASNNASSDTPNSENAPPLPMQPLSAEPIAGPSRTAPQSPARYHPYHPPSLPFTQIHPHNYPAHPLPSYINYLPYSLAAFVPPTSYTSA